MKVIDNREKISINHDKYNKTGDDNYELDVEL
jgi:hypothetical protein